MRVRMGVKKERGKGLRIDSSTIGMESARSYQASNTTTRRFMIKDYQETFAQNGNTLNTTVNDNTDGEVQEEKAQSDNTDVVTEWKNRYSMSASRVNLRSSSSNTMFDIRQATVRYIFELLFSTRKSLFDDWTDRNGWSGSESSQSFGEINSGAQVQQNALFMTNMKVLNYSQETWQMETEDTSFSTVGTVRTADGREINFNVNVGMSREFQQYYKDDLNLASFQMCDPLVINLDTDVTELSDQKFYFDIDADGEKDEVSMLGRGSGYLALDKNGDGTINDGSELFGTESGNGFADLAKYDEDGNGWIDENDSVWSKLQIWCKDENGQDVLYRLADKGVGAICLQNASTDFTMKAADGSTKGAIRSTGVFLYENGNVGTMQHVDVAKYSKEA